MRKYLFIGLFILILTSPVCDFVLASEVNYTIITSDRIEACSAQLEKGIGNILGEVKPRRLDYNSSQAKALIKELGIQFIPYVIFDKNLQQNDKFYELARRGMVELKDGRYVIPEGMLLAPGAMFLDRRRNAGRLDVFLTNRCEGCKDALQQIDAYLNAHPGAFKVDCHYLVNFREFGIDAPGGVEEIKEDANQLLIQKYYPDKFWPYIRLYLADKPFGEICKELGISADKIAALRKREGGSLLKKDFDLAKDVGVKSSPTLLWENQVIFFSWGAFHKFFSWKSEVN